jgi:hypothetical protein
MLSLLVLVSCNERKKVVSEYENNFDNTKNEERMKNLEDRVSALETSVTLNISAINLNSSNIANLQTQLSSEIVALSEEIVDLKLSILALEASSEDNANELVDQQQTLNNLQIQLNDAIAQGGAYYSNIMNSISTINTTNGTLQNSVNTLISQLAQLQLQESVVAIVDPCPTVSSTGYREYFFKMKSGKLVAYFENGNQRFLTTLTPGNYRTTDSRACNFSVDANNVIH